jgi:DUF4097 and DUF4098 domain-containing protein YvlB
MASVQEMACLQPTSFRQTSLNKTTVVTLVLVTCLSATAIAQTKKEYRFTVGPKADISVDTQYGGILVRPGTGTEVVVTATLKSANVEVDQQQNGNRIEIASHMLRGEGQENGQVDYELLVPVDATVNVRSSSGPLWAEGLRGDLTIEGSDAVVNVRNINNGHVNVRTMRGPVTLTDVHNAHVDINSISGAIHLKSVTGPVIQATTSRGQILYDGDFGSRGEYKFNTHTGDIEALVPAAVSADFKAHSVLGRVQHDFPLQPRHSRYSEQAGSSFVGSTGKASSEVVLRSFSGRIRLKQR